MRLGLQLKPFVSPFTCTEPRSVPHRGWDVVFRSPLLDNQILTGRRLFLRRDTRFLSESAWSPNLYPCRVPVLSGWDGSASPWFLQMALWLFSLLLPLTWVTFSPSIPIKVPSPTSHSTCHSDEPCVTPMNPVSLWGTPRHSDKATR